MASWARTSARTARRSRPKSSGTRRRRKESSTFWSRSISACRRPACIPTSCCRPPPGTRRTTSTPPTCIPSSIRSPRRSIRCGGRAATGKSTRASPRLSRRVAPEVLGVEKDVVLTPDHARHARRDRAALRREGLEDAARSTRSPARPCRRSPWSSATIPISTSASPRSGR